MATLSVLKFNDPYGADRVMVALQGMQEREMISLEDAAVVSWPQGNRKPTTHQLHSTAGAGAGWGAFWGFLFGMIFFVPFLGAAIGAGMGGMTGALADVGISDDFIKEVRDKVTEGTSALFALTSGATAPDKVIDELKQYDFEIISTNLPEEQEQQLREAFALTSGATAPDKVVDELKQYDFEIISTNLPEEQEQQLREAFAHEG